MRGKLLSGFGAVLGLTAILGIAALLGLRGTAIIARSMYADRVIPLRDLAQVRADLGDIDSQIQRAITDRPGADRTGYTTAAERDAAEMDRLLAAYTGTRLTADALDGLAAYQQAWSTYQATFRAVLRAAEAGDLAGATDLYFARAAPEYVRQDAVLARLIDVNDREAKLADDEIDATYARALTTIGGALAVALVLGGIIAVRYAAQAERDRRAIEEQAEALRATEAHNRALLSAIPDALYRVDRTGRIVERRAAPVEPDEVRLEYEGRTIADLVGTEIGAGLMRTLEQSIATGLLGTIEYELPWPGGPYFREARIVPLGGDQVLALVRDIGERKRAEQERERLTAQLSQAQKMEALGQLASGIVHDFNNALTMIVGGIELLQLRPDVLQGDEDLQKYLRLMSVAAEDAGSVVGRLRELYRPREEGVPFRSVDLARIVYESVEMTRPRWESQAQAASIRVELRTELAATPTVLGSASELREALVNLIFNAVDAMPAGGTITVSTAVADSTVQLVVTDTGVGMTEDVRRRCLDPFFTTKGEHGSGLGLGMVYGVAMRHQGALNVESAVGAGTTFTLSLPLDGLVGQALANSTPAADVPRLDVLVVDDEPRICDVVRAFLERDGHQVAVATSGSAALDLLAARPFSLLITDRAMPEMSGDRLAVSAHQLRPEMPVIMLTGFGPLMRAQGEIPPAVDLLLDKPVQLAQLRRALADVVESRRVAS